MEEDLGSEDRQQTVLIAEPLQEHREHERRAPLWAFTLANSEEKAALR